MAPKGKGQARNNDEKELLKGLDEAQIEKVSHCRSGEEILKVAQQEGFELTKEQLEAVNGGGCGTDATVSCPCCNSWFDVGPTESGEQYYCYKCKIAIGQRN